jgi:hypothetical protein
MTTKKSASTAGKTPSYRRASKAVTSAAASALTQRLTTQPHMVTAISGKVIVRTVMTHREALKRLADR